MRFFFTFAAIALAGLSYPATAQQMRPPQDVPRAPATMLQDYTTFCTGDRPSVSLKQFGVERATFTAQDNDLDVLAECIDSYRIARITRVDTIGNALAMLSFRSFEPFWPTMEQEWGADLHLLREELADIARDLRDPGLGMIVSQPAARQIAQASALRNLGYYEEALDLIDSSYAELEGSDQRRLQRFEFERTLLATYRASIRSDAFGHAAGAQAMGEFLAGFPDSSEFRLNPLINHAAFLAESGDHAASYRIIVPAYDEFRGLSYSPDTYQIGGVDREFAWIIACDRARMGNVADALPFIEIVENAPEQPRDQYFAYVKRSTSILRRMYRCMGDGEGWFAQFADGTLPPLDSAWIFLQPAYRGQHGPMAGWEMPEEVATRFASLYRELPDSYAPALRLWQEERR